MGHELVVSAAYTDTYLPLYDDLTDLRLPRVLNSWLRFKDQHYGQVSAIEKLSTGQVGNLAIDLSASIEEAVGLARIGTGKGVALSPQKTTSLLEYLSGDGDKLLFMRHGEQSPPQWVYSIDNPTIRKIRMMQNPFNRDDGLTNKGFVDVFATSLGLLYLQQQTGKNLHIMSSSNRRARDVAEVISYMIPNTTFTSLEGLDSISYRDETCTPPTSLEELIDELPPGGDMPWDPELVNKLCKPTRTGGQPAQAIVETVESLLRFSNQGNNNILLALTHSQQLSEVLKVRGAFPDTSVRYPELTMIGADAPQVQIFPRGVLEITAPGSIGG